MSTPKVAHISILVVFLLNSTICVLTANAQTVFVRLIIRNDYPPHPDDIGEIVSRDGSNIVELVQSIPADRSSGYDFWALTGRDGTATRSALQQQLRDADLGPDDTLFVYFTGHGGRDPLSGKGFGGTFLDMQDGRLYRDDLVGEINRYAGHTRLRILVTDTCSESYANVMRTTDFSPRQMKTTDISSYKLYEPDRPEWWGYTVHRLENLFFGHTGFLHVTSSPDGHFSYGYCNDGLGWGSFITHSFIWAIQAASTGRDGHLSWRDVLNIAIPETNKIFKYFIRTDGAQTTQVPLVYSYPVPLNQ